MPRDLFIDGVPELLLLRLLARKEMYGYELVSEISKRSNNVFTFGEGCIYPILHRLVSQKQLSVRKETVSGRPRRYYKLTAKGNHRLSELESSWSNVSAGVTSFGKALGNVAS
ncbi:PadR family transcriptional regulator [Puniceicoccaceae bacterium K14]|nr:PadR family transcriptional regulator [Puniceicoccaceae bacterium K14]